MARVKGALFSLDASGQFGKSLVFDRRGYVRTYRIPANPQSAEQGNIRQMLKAAQKAIAAINRATVVETLIKPSVPIGYRWNSYLVGKIVGKDSDNWTAADAAYLALQEGERAAWESDANTLGIQDTEIPYADAGTISKGLALFALCRALLNIAPENAPSSVGTNSDDWSTYITTGTF